MQKIFEYLFTNPEMEYMARALAWDHVKICGGFIALFVFLALAWNVIVSSISSKFTKPVSFEELVRVLFMAFLITAYVPLMEIPMMIFGALEKETRISLTEMKEFGEELARQNFNSGMAGTLNDNYSLDPDENKDTKPEEESGKETMSLWEFLGSSLSPINMGAFLMDAVTIPIVGIIRIVVQSIAVYAKLIFYILGPFAILASIFWKNQFRRWFDTYVSFLFLPVVYNVLENLLYFNLIKSAAGPVNLNDALISTAFNFTVIIMFILSFWISGKIVGSADAGRVISGAMDSMTMALSHGMKGIKLGKGLQKVAPSGTGSGTSDPMSSK